MRLGQIARYQSGGLENRTGPNGARRYDQFNGFGQHARLESGRIIRIQCERWSKRIGPVAVFIWHNGIAEGCDAVAQQHHQQSGGIGRKIAVRTDHVADNERLSGDCASCVAILSLLRPQFGAAIEIGIGLQTRHHSEIWTESIFANHSRTEGHVPHGRPADNHSVGCLRTCVTRPFRARTIRGERSFIAGAQRCWAFQRKVNWNTQSPRIQWLNHFLCLFVGRQMRASSKHMDWRRRHPFAR